MKETKNKNMGVDHSPSTKKKGKSSVSKMDMKLALVAKRIAMLQDDDDDHQHHQSINPVLAIEYPVQCESPKPTRDINDDLMSEDIVMSKSSKNPKKYGSHKRGRVVSDDESSEDRELSSTIQPIDKRSHKGGKVVRDDESSEDRELVTTIQPIDKRSNKRVKAANDDESPMEDREFNVCVQSSKKGSTKQKMVKNADISKKENVKATNNNLKTQIIQRTDLSYPLSASDKSSSMKRAEDVQENLPPKDPSFVKLMSKSHVSGGFWLGLPKAFCDDHLPICDSTVVLVDEAGKESNTKYLAAKVGLSGGWRGFSIDHDLVEGDVLVFHLIAPTKFKIYIIREQTFGEVDGALGLLTLECGRGQQHSEDNSPKVAPQTEDNYTMVDYVSPSTSDVDLGPEVLDGICFSDSVVDFKGVESFENFNISVEGLVIDSKFSESTRKKYYELCCNRRSFLHENFKGLNGNLVVGIISETVNIADAIESCKGASTSHEDLKIWEKTLKGFELLGMKVGFLLARVNELLGLASEDNATYESNRLKESIIKRDFAGERMKALENKLTQLKETMARIDLELETEIKMASALKQEAKIKETTAV